MPDYTFVGDPHAQVSNLDKITAMYNLAESLGNPIITLGDLLHTKSIVQSATLNHCLDIFSKSKLQHYILVGNHDYHNDECLAHSLEPFKQLPNVTIIDKPLKLKELLLVPYYNDLAKFRQEVLTQSDGNTVLVMHQGVNGFDYGNGFLADKELNLEELQGFKRIISGHFHKCQLKDNLVYPGTPFSHSFGESNQRKCIASLNSKTVELKLINTDLPQHCTIEINCDDPEQLNKLYTFSVNNYHRALLIGKETNIHKFPKKYYPTVKFIEQPNVQQTNDDIKESDTPEQTFMKWAKEVANLDDLTIKLGLSILKDTNV